MGSRKDQPPHLATEYKITWTVQQSSPERQSASPLSPIFFHRDPIATHFDHYSSTPLASSSLTPVTSSALLFLALRAIEPASQRTIVCTALHTAVTCYQSRRSFGLRTEQQVRPGCQCCEPCASTALWEVKLRFLAGGRRAWVDGLVDGCSMQWRATIAPCADDNVQVV